MEIRFSRFAADLLPSSAETWTLSGTLLTTPQNKTVDLKKVTHASFFDFRRKENWITKLTLTTPGQSTTIHCTDWLDGEDRRRYFYLILAILNQLNHCNPALKIYWDHSRLRRCLQSAATLPVLGGATKLLMVSMTAAVYEGVVAPYVFFAVPSLGVVLLATYAIWKFSPWRSTRKLTPAGTKERIQQHLSTQLNLVKSHCQ